MKENQLLLKDLLEFQKIKSTNKEKEVNDKEPKFKVGDRVRISKCKNNFAKGYTSNWSEEGFVISKIKKTVPCTYVINDLNGEKGYWKCL